MICGTEKGPDTGHERKEETDGGERKGGDEMTERKGVRETEKERTTMAILPFTTLQSFVLQSVYTSRRDTAQSDSDVAFVAINLKSINRFECYSWSNALPPVKYFDYKLAFCCKSRLLYYKSTSPNVIVAY
jgi:hypothetical protein